MDKWVQQLFLSFTKNCKTVLHFEKELENRTNIALNLSIHPLRFADDIFFNFQTYDPELAKRLRKYEVNYNIFYHYADIVKATYLKSVKKNSIASPNTLLLIGQTEHDKVIFDGQKHLNLLDYSEHIADLAKQYDAIYFKPHPYAKNSRYIYHNLKKVLGNVMVIHDNVYHLLSNDNIAHVAALNSSVLYEAKYFRKEVTFLYKPTFDFEAKDIGIYGDYWNSAFWADVLGVEDTGVSLPFAPNRLRKALNDFWGYNEISDEIILKDILKNKVKYFLSRYLR